MKTSEHALTVGLNPMEYLATSIQSCLQVMIVLIGTEKKLKIGEITWTTTITVNPKGAAGTPMKVSLFADITLDDDEDKAKLEEVMNTVEGRCPLYTMCKLVGLDVVLNYGVNGEKKGDDATSSDDILTNFVLQTTGKAMQSTITTADSKEVVVDEPEALGGTNTGGNPMDYLGAAVQSALQMTLMEVVKEKGLTVEGVEWTANVGIDLEGLMGVKDAVVYPQSIKLTANVSMQDQDRSGFEKLGKEVEDRCDFYVLMRDSGLKMNVTFTLDGGDEEQKQQESKGQWMELVVNGTANDDTLTMKTSEHALTEGLNPMEYLAASIQSCLQVMIVLIGTENELKIGEIAWTTTIAVDPKGAAGKPMTVALFADITLDDDQDKAKIETVMKTVEGRCPLYTMCKMVGIDVVLNYGVNGAKGSDGDNALEIDEKFTKFELKMTGNAMQSKVTTADSKEAVIDEPEALGGTNTGAGPIDYLAAAVQSALQMTLVEVAKEKGLAIEGVEWTAGVGFDLEGLMGVKGAVVNPQSIKVTANVAMKDQDQSALEKLGKEVEDRCDFYLMCKEGGLDMDVKYTLKQN